MTEERVCRTCARSMFTAKRRADAECEAYDLLVWCRRDPGRARRVEPHGTCDSWKGFDDDGGKDDGE